MFRNLLVISFVLMLVPAALSAQASGRLKASATVVASQSVAPQTSAAELAEWVVERMEHGEQVAVLGTDRMDVVDSGVTVLMDVAEQPDMTAPVIDQDLSEQQWLQVTVAYSGN